MIPERCKVFGNKKKLALGQSLLRYDKKVNLKKI
jgi:hypothetical protein